MSHNVARHSYCSTALLHLSHGIAASQWICRAPARDAGKAKSYQSVHDMKKIIQVAAAALALASAVHAQQASFGGAQPTCESAQPLALGVTQVASLLSFPAWTVPGPCGGPPWQPDIHHATFHRFTAPQAGQYVFGAASVDGSWHPSIALLSDCGPGGEGYFGQGGTVPVPEGEACASSRGGHVVSRAMLAGEEVVVVVGSGDINSAGVADVFAVRTGATLMADAQALELGSNSYWVPAWLPPVPFAGTCGFWDGSIIANASRFTFQPAKTGIYRISFCGSRRRHVAVSPAETFPVGQTAYGLGGCPWSDVSGDGGRITMTLEAGTRYYIAAGDSWFLDACSSRNVTVELIPSCPTDLDGDGVVGGSDLGLILAAWGTDGADVTGDGITDGLDLGVLLATWGICGSSG